MVRTRADLHCWSASNAYGSQLHEAVAVLRQAAQDEPADQVLGVTQRAIASALRVIWRADDSSGIIGDAIQDLLDLHADLVRAAQPPAAKVVDWMVNFQFVQEVDYFTIDPVAYAPAPGEKGLARYRAKLAEIADTLGPELTDEQEAALWAQRATDPERRERRANDRHVRFTLAWNAQRLAVWDRDVPAIIATHARDRKVAAWFKDTAEALAEIGEFDLAIDWARQAAEFGPGHQSVDAAAYWCTLLAEHRPQDELPARLEVFRRWPTAGHGLPYAGRPAMPGPTIARRSWPDWRSVPARPSHSPCIRSKTLGWPGQWRTPSTWTTPLWDELATAYEKIDPLAALSVHTARAAVTGDWPPIHAQRLRRRRGCQGPRRPRGTTAIPSGRR